MATLGLEEFEGFSQGHNACSGCLEALAIRHVLKASGPKTIAVSATGCMEVVSSAFPQTSWRIPWIHSAFENAPAVASGIDKALKVLKKRDGVNLIVFGGDGASFDIGFQALSGAIERGHKFLYVVTDNEAYANCLTLDSLIMAQDGLKKITGIKAGDMVCAFDQKTRKLVLKKCIGVFDNGVKRVFEINTDSQTIKATGNHPLLALKRNGRGSQSELVWKTVEELKAGDQVVALKQGLEGNSYVFSKISQSKKGDYKVNKIRTVSLPEKSSAEVMKLLGIFVGDGWVRSEKAELGFSVPVNDKAREPVIELTNKVFGVKPNRETKNELYLGSINAAKFIDSLGFGKGAKYKTIPSWVFILPEKEKEAFIDGLMLSDGHKAGKSWRYSSASHDLIRTLRLLLQTMNVRVGKIHKIEAKKGKQVAYRKLLKDSICYYIAFSMKKGRNANYPSQYKYDNFLYSNNNFEMKRIKSIKRFGLEPTLDLQVEGEHNFIANGLVVHNTGMQRSSASLPYSSTTTSPAGKKIPGKLEPKKPLSLIIASHGVPFVASATLSNPLDLARKVKKALSYNAPSFLHVLAPCVIGWDYEGSKGIDIARLAVQTNVFPLFEIENGVLSFSQKTPKEQAKPVEAYLKTQGRFKHLTPELTQKIQEYVNARYAFLEGIEGKKAFDVLY